jgi:hypothetical protein
MAGSVGQPLVAAPGADHARAVRRLTILLAIAVAVSVVHYADNYLNYDSFPTADDLPAPSAGLVGFSWFAFTAAGLLGYVLFRRGRHMRAACLLLGYYSLSGLVGLGHYAAPAMFDAVWWRQAHVIADIGCGIAVLAFAVWAFRSLASPRPRLSG